MHEYYLRRRIDDALARLDSLEQAEPSGIALRNLLGEFNHLAGELAKVLEPEVPAFRGYESDWDPRFSPMKRHGPCGWITCGRTSRN